MAKLTKERRLCLSWWERDGWSIGRPMSRGTKKWEQHIAMLVKDGLLEGDNSGMHRITDAGRAALSSPQHPSGE